MALNEFDIIERFFAHMDRFPSSHVTVGPGDDCAILDVPAHEQLCVSTDTLLEGVHFPKGASGDVVAHRSFAANMSDLAAMGARPVGYTLALVLPDPDEEWLTAFSAKLSELGKSLKVPLIGGNVSRGTSAVTLTVMGVVPKGTALMRSGAVAGDDVYVSGTLGDAVVGLRLFGGPGSWLLDRYRFPTARIDLGQALRGVATSVIDISDGFAADLAHVCAASRVGAIIELDRLPVSTDLESMLGNVDARMLAVNAGDDYELCFTAKAGSEQVIAALAARLALPIAKVGRIVEGDEVQILDSKRTPITLSEPGYQHFNAS